LLSYRRFRMKIQHLIEKGYNKQGLTKQECKICSSKVPL